MLLTIHDANLQKVAFIDNEKQSTLNYYDDTWTRNLETGSSTFEFTVFKKAIQSDTTRQKTYNYLNEKAFVSFKYNGKSYVFSVMTVEEDEQTIKCYCENLNLELINEYANPYKATKAMSFVEYCNAMDLLNFTHLMVGINEISDQKRTLEWEGQDTKLARLLSLATKFDAEIDFDTELNADSSIKAFKVNVYHENDDNHQGVGRVRNDIQLTYGKNLKSIKRKIDKTGIYTMIRPTGKGKTKNAKGEEVETVVTIGGLGAWSENNADGVREFYQSGEALYAPLAAQMYPSTFTSGTQKDQWIRKDLVVESDNPTVIRATAIRDLKKNAYPALTYEVDGFLDVEIGDTIKIYDDGFTPILLIRARVSDQKISFTNPTSNKTTFANFKALENAMSDGIQAAFERLFEAAKPYTIKLATDNGVIFKNQIGQSLVTPTLYKGGKPVTTGVTWRWSLDGDATTGMTYLVKGSSVTDTVTLTVAAYIGNDEVAVDEISLVNVVDGKLGTPGTPGKDGRTPYVHTAWANNATGTSGFSLDSSINKLYIGIYTDFEPNDSTDPTKYKWTLIKGEKGDKGEQGERGLQGLQGAKGDQGIAGAKGADGKSSYTHIAYATNSTGTQGFSVSDSTNKTYIGMYVDNVEADSTIPSKYNWTLVKGADGAQGVPGVKGTDGRTPYLHLAYATNATGTQGFSVTDSANKTYIGQYTDYTAADSTDPTKYKWTLIKGEKGDRGATGAQGIQGLQGPKGDQGIPGVAGKDGKTQYTHIAYADNATGGGFSQTDQTKAYIGMYQDFNATDITNPTAYKWTKWRGSDGAQGVPGKAGADGKTPYVHFAYANSTDGRTEFSTTQTGNKRYLGTYTDFTQNDSTDPTKYKWVDMVGTVEVSHRNLAIGSSDQWNNFITINSNNNWGAKLATVLYGDSTGIYAGTTINIFVYLSADDIVLDSTINPRFFIQGAVIDKQNNMTWTDWDKYNPFFNKWSTSLATGNNYRIVKISSKVTAESYANIKGFELAVRIDGVKSGKFHWRALMITTGTAFPSYWTKPIEDTQSEVDSKADQVLTQEQINALNEKSQILEAEMQAKASMEAFSELEKAYNAFVAKNEKDTAQSEKDLIEAGRRIELLITQFGGLKELKTFIDTYMTSSNEGLIIGKNDASSTIKVSSDRISMFSAGREVMYISQGVIHIDNGIFTASVQIGKFRTEQYHLNADMNVIRYVG